MYKKSLCIIFLSFICITLAFSGCDSSDDGSGDDTSTGESLPGESTSNGDGDASVTLPDDINSEAKEEGNFPDDATVVESDLKVNGESADGKESKEVANSDNDDSEATVSIPKGLSKRLSRLSIPGTDDLPIDTDDITDQTDKIFTLNIWLNGEKISLLQSLAVGDEIKVNLDLREGANYFCLLFEIPALNKQFRTPVIKITALEGDDVSGATAQPVTE